MSESEALPEGWAWAALGDVAQLNQRPNVNGLPDDTPVSFVPMAALEAGTGRMDPGALRPLKEVRRGYTSFQDGDVLFAKITPCMENGKVAVARELASGIGFGSTEFHVIRSYSGVSPSYLYHYLSRGDLRQSARARMTGTAGQLRVPESFLADLSVPLAPEAEQRRIVAAIEQHFTRLDAGVAALKRAQAALKRYRASVLKAAVEGILTEQWRADHPDAEPASAPLARILAERRACWESDLRAKGKDPANVGTTRISPARSLLDSPTQ
jgi:type I restriction enzyme S subunit